MLTILAKCTQAVRQYRRDVNPARAFLLDNYLQVESHVKRGFKYLAPGFTGFLTLMVCRVLRSIRLMCSGAAGTAIGR